MATTQRFGLNKFGGALGGSITDDGGKFSSTDRDTIDRLLSSLEVHDHHGGARLANPSAAPTAALGSGGALAAGTTYYYRVSYVDAYGLETAGSAEVNVTTPPVVQPPSSPVASTSPGGTLPPGLYYWAGTSIVGGVETPLGDSTIFTVPVGEGTATLDFNSLPTGADSIGVWRQGPSDSGFTKVGTVAGSIFIDDGSVPSDSCACDPTHLPPSENLTGATSKVTITLPVADQAAVGAFPTGSVLRWRLYRSEQSGVYPASALVHEVIETTDGTPATGLVVAWIDLGDVPPTAGAPLAASITLTPSRQLTFLNSWLAVSPETMFVGAITRDADDAATSAGVVWPDGTTGTYTGTPSTAFPGAVDSYTITYGPLTYTQPAVTRNASGAVITRPAITVS